MAVMIVAHPIPGFSGRVAVEEVGLNFIGGFTGPTDVPADVQAQMVAAGFTLNANPSVGHPLAYVTHSELEDPDSEASLLLRAAFDAWGEDFGGGGIAGAVGDGIADDLAAINAALNAARLAGGGVVKGTPGHTYRITGPPVIGSDTILDVEGCTFDLDVPAQSNILVNYAALNTQRTITGGAITAGQATLTAAGAAWSSADIGRSVVVPGAGVELAAFPGSVGPLCARVLSFVGTTATLDTPAATTVAGATISVYNRDKNITVIGGTWNAGNNQSGADNFGRFGTRFRRVDGLTIRDFKGTSTGGKYMINAADVTDVVVDHPHLEVASDGVHITGPARGVTVRGFTGHTGDDAVAFGTFDWPQYNDSQGDISDVLIENTSVTTDINMIKLFNQTGFVFRGVKILNTRGRVLGDNTVVNIATEQGSEDGWIDDVLVDGVDTEAEGAFCIAVSIVANSKKVEVRSAKSRMTHNVQVGIGTEVERLVIDGSTHAPDDPGEHMVNLLGTVGELTVTDYDADLTDSSSLIRFGSAGSVGTLRVGRGSARGVGSGAIVMVDQAGATLGRVFISDGVTADALAWILAMVHGTTTAHLSDIVNDNAPGLIYVGPSASVTVRNGAGIAGNAVGVTREGTLAVKAPDFPIDIITPNSRTTGDRAFNTNAARACGVGPVMWNGTAWANLATGATYTPA